MDLMDANDVTVEGHGAVRLLRWHRPAKRNAITMEMYAAMVEHLVAAEADPTVRAVVLAGDDKAFSAGNDLDDFVANPPSGNDAPVLRFLHVIAAFSKPLLAAVKGQAIGVGTTMLLHCDLVYAGTDALFALPFVQLGLCPEAASSLLLPRLAGYQRAAEKFFFGDPFDAEEAHQMGLVNRVLEPEKVEAEALRQALRLAALPPAALRATKALLKADPGESVSSRIVREVSRFDELLREPAAQEALSAFAERRRPDFSNLA